MREGSDGVLTLGLPVVGGSGESARQDKREHRNRGRGGGGSKEKVRKKENKGRNRDTRRRRGETGRIWMIASSPPPNS